MLKIEKADGTLLTVASFRPRDLEKAAATLPLRDNLLVMPTMVLIMPFTDQARRTIAIDAEFGPYATSMATRAITRKMGMRMTPFHAELDETRRRVYAEMGLHGKPPRIIPYFLLFYFPLGRSEAGDYIWIAGNYLKDLTIVGPHVARIQFQTETDAGFTVTLSSPTLPNARRLSELEAFAAAVTREMQPLLRQTYGTLCSGAQFSRTLPDNYAHLDPRGDPSPTTVVINQYQEEFEHLWQALAVLLKAEDPAIDLAELKAQLLERWRHYQ
ncbi:hypothetical protein [Lacticaseibacillus hegangensis]|uniref:Uncharacterized protein n=1 Tax=Lacticaseibacillus hegangensis TaxID=2486010 RepID=A0ABW4CW10_9LACO|nr:hypothetical protein [Lacticaseibacillus hegangensis]